MRTGIWNGVALAVGILVLALGGPWLAGHLRSLPHPARLAARADQRVVTLEVGGMTCSGCARRIETELSATPGVAAADVRVAQDRAYVVCEKSLPDSALLGAVRRAGPGYLAAIVPR